MISGVVHVMMMITSQVKILVPVMNKDMGVGDPVC
jgi:hypothetical protein